MADPINASDLAGFVSLETAVWEALVAGDAAADAAALRDDFLGLYPTGYATKADHVGQLSNGPTVQQYSLHEPRLVTVADDAALLCYRAAYVRAGSQPTEVEHMWVSSLWQQTDAGWTNSFSQDTPASDQQLP
jgi:hypothetical protein